MFSENLNTCFPKRARRLKHANGIEDIKDEPVAANTCKSCYVKDIDYFGYTFEKSHFAHTGENC